MIRLEHVNLVVKDMKASLDFIQTAFPHWRVRGQGESEWYGQKRQWLHVGTDLSYITLNQGNDEDNRNLKSHTPGLAHIGFEVDDMEGISQRLQAKGYEIATIGADHPFRKTIYFIDPAGFEFEFIQYLSDKPEEKNLYGGETTGITRISTAVPLDFPTTPENLVHELYQNAVDLKDVKKLAMFLTDDVTFQLGNQRPIHGKSQVLTGNQAFFKSIRSMAHQLDHIWVKGDDVICSGSVQYIRLDGSELTASFATVLKLQKGKIAEYKVYADISEL